MAVSQEASTCSCLVPALILLEALWAQVDMQVWILLRAQGISGRAGPASSAPEACSGETAWVWGSAFK